MDNTFWIERWAQRQTGFHQTEFNPYLVRYWRELAVPEASEIFVPLCGKSSDMLWLRAQGYRVVGVECAEQACREFFADNQIDFDIEESESFKKFVADGLTLYCGDLFNLSAQSLANVAAVYDRASMIALPPAMRTAYVEHMTTILPSPARILLVTMEYLQTQMDGPPFAVLEEEVLRSYQPRYEVQSHQRQDVLQDNPRFVERGLTQLAEVVYTITPRKQLSDG